MVLNQQHCVPCQVSAPTLTPKEIEALKPQISPQWEIIDHKKLLRNFKFPNFKTAIEFINQVADLAEAAGHHPNIHLTNWNRVALELYTHKISGLHHNDFILASKIDQIK